MKAKCESGWLKTLLLLGSMFFLATEHFTLRNIQASAASNPFSGAKLYIDPNSSANKQADEWRASGLLADAAQMDKIAGQPQADWFGDWNTDVQAAVNQRVSEITAESALPVLVAYNIPYRDCNSYSAGGATSPEAYRSWISAFAKGIGSRMRCGGSRAGRTGAVKLSIN